MFLIGLHEVLELFEAQFSILVLVEPLEDGVDLRLRHLLGRLPQLRLGQVAISVPVVGVERELGLLVEVALALNLGGGSPGGPGRGVGGLQLPPGVHFHELIERDPAIPVLVVAGDRAFDPFAI